MSAQGAISAADASASTPWKRTLYFVLLTNILCPPMFQRLGLAPGTAQWVSAVSMPAALIALIAGWREASRASWSQFWIRPPSRFRAYLIGVTSGLGALLVGLALIRAVGSDREANAVVYRGMFSGAAGRGSLWAMVVLFAATEELFFRGVLLSDLGRRYGKGAAVVASAAAFAAYHLNWKNSPQHLSLGIFCGVAAVASESVYPAILAHALYNGVILKWGI